MNVKVNHVAGHGKTQSGIDSMEEGRVVPVGAEDLLVMLFLFVCLFRATNCVLCCSCSSQFDEVCDEQVTWNLGGQNQSKDDVLLAIVVAFDADKNTILDTGQTFGLRVARIFKPPTFMKFSMISRRFIATIARH